MKGKTHVDSKLPGCSEFTELKELGKPGFLDVQVDSVLLWEVLLLMELSNYVLQYV